MVVVLDSTPAAAINAIDTKSPLLKAEALDLDMSSDKDLHEPESTRISITSSTAAPASKPTPKDHVPGFHSLMTSLPDRGMTPCGTELDPITLDDSPSESLPMPLPTLPSIRRIQGRSYGEHSSLPIKQARAQAERGDIDAAFKLGWSVERLTHIFNQQKLARGIPVTSLNEPIDDEVLIDRIQARKKSQCLASRRREEKLKARAKAGDREAAMKLKRCDRTVEKWRADERKDDKGEAQKTGEKERESPRQAKANLASSTMSPRANGKPMAHPLITEAHLLSQQQPSPAMSITSINDSFRTPAISPLSSLPSVDRLHLPHLPHLMLPRPTLAPTANMPPHMLAIEDQLRIGIAEAQNLVLFATHRMQSLGDMLQQYHGHRIALANAMRMEGGMRFGETGNGKGKGREEEMKDDEEVRKKMRMREFVWVQESGLNREEK